MIPRVTSWTPYIDTAYGVVYDGPAAARLLSSKVYCFQCRRSSEPAIVIEELHCFEIVFEEGLPSSLNSEPV